MTQSEKKAMKIGKFRLQGEVHLCMYDRFSLGRLLNQIGFQNPVRCTAFESSIHNWSCFELDFHKDTIRKPDSLFMEAIKK